MFLPALVIFDEAAPNPAAVSADAVLVLVAELSAASALFFDATTVSSAEVLAASAVRLDAAALSSAASDSRAAAACAASA